MTGAKDRATSEVTQGRKSGRLSMENGDGGCLGGGKPTGHSLREEEWTWVLSSVSAVPGG